MTMRWIGAALVVISSATAVTGFFLPWARIDLQEPGLVKQLRAAAPLRETVSGFTRDLGRITVKVRQGAKTITGNLPSLSDIPKQVSGVEIPQMVRRENAQVAIALFELLTNTRQHIGMKSSAVYLVPGIVLLCGVLILVLGHRRGVAIGTALLCGAIAGAGFWKLSTTNPKTLFVAITIGPGLWLSLWAYVGLAIAAGVTGAARRARA